MTWETVCELSFESHVAAPQELWCLLGTAATAAGVYFKDCCKIVCSLVCVSHSSSLSWSLVLRLSPLLTVRTCICICCSSSCFKTVAQLTGAGVGTHVRCFRKYRKQQRCVTSCTQKALITRDEILGPHVTSSVDPKSNLGSAFQQHMCICLRNTLGYALLCQKHLNKIGNV